MKTNIEEIVNRYQNRYQRIFEQYYPAHGSTGFTERNLSVNFSTAFESVEESSITWYEAPIGEKKKEHYDAVIFNVNKKEIFVIESKRFSNPKQKLRSMGNDIKRITDKKNLNLVCGNLLDKEQYKIYGVILADVWTETKPKKKIFDKWGEGFLGAYANKMDLSEEHLKESLEMYWYKKSFSSIRDIKCIEKYKLLIMITEV